MVSRKLVLGAVSSAVGLSLAACNTISVKTDGAPDVTLASCQSYAFAQEHVANIDQPAAYGNPLNAQRLKNAVQANLSAKGIQVADKANADCIIGYALGTRQVVENYYGGLGWGYGAGYGGWGRGRYGGGGFGGGFGYYDGPWVQNETRIAVDVYDAKSHKPIWHASASQTTNDLSGPNADVKINAATTAIFNKWPGGGART